jgi:toxin ParE1/3/4
LIVSLSNRAEAELDLAVAFVRESNPRVSKVLHLTIERALESLEIFPNRGRPGQIDGTRELVVQGTPFIIVYSVSDDEVLIARIRHTSQDPAP